MQKNDSIPQYRKLYELLRKHIEEGLYAEGDLLPSENELCLTHNLTRPTVRHALDALVNDGYIKKHKGKGSIVSGKSKEIGILSIHGTTSAVGKNNLRTQIIMPPRVTAWEEPFFFDLSELEKESGCIRLERLRLVRNKPVFYDINFLPNINLPRFTSRKLEDKSLFEVLRLHYQIDVTGGEQRIKAIEADKKLGRFLDIEKGKPVLHMERKLDTNRNDYRFYSSTFCNTSGYSLYGTF
jgi:GntR family transcriptional regulator/GntR family frlABCD operon transcriptional regulator